MRRSLWLIGLLVVALTIAGCLGGSSGLRLTIKIEGEGRVLRDPNYTSYRQNSVVNLTAQPEEGWSFVRWEGDLVGNDPEVQVVMTDHLTVTAVFAKSGKVPESTGTLRGFVSDGQGGPAVEGALVSWNGAYQTTTDAQGEFTLLIPAGQVGDIIVERPDGGATRVQAVQVEEGKERVFDIPTRRSFGPNLSPIPPTVELNVAPGDILSGTYNLQVKVSGENSTYVLYVYVGGEQRSPREGMVIEEDELEVLIDTTALPNGETYIRILAYDNNENTVIYMVPIIIFNQAPWQSSAPAAIPLVGVISETYAENIGYYSKEAILEKQQRQNRLAAPKLADIEAVPGDSMLIVYILWLPESNADGYKVYRSFDAVNYREIATIGTKHASGGVFQVTDYSPQLAPGKRAFYKVVPYNSVGYGPATVVDVTPLPPMDIYLVSPGNGAKDVELDPTFTWELRTKAEFPADAYIEYLLTVYDATSWLIVDDWISMDEEAQLGFSLNPGHVYTWDIADSYAEHFQTEGPSAFSEAYSYGGLALGDTQTGSRNGEFIFTTIAEIEE